MIAVSEDQDLLFFYFFFFSHVSLKLLKNTSYIIENFSLNWKQGI